jgi:hypothetical protein
MLRLIFMLFFAVTLASVRERELERLRAIYIIGDTQENFDKNIKPLTEALAKAQGLVLYEGLPHQRWESDLLENELKEKKSIVLRHFPFYEATIHPKEEDTKKLSAICVNRQSFERYGGLSMCCVYHPDWCLEWRDGNTVCQVLICFGCGEAILYGPKNVLHTRLNPAQGKELGEILQTYRKNRPKSEGPK